MILRTEAQPRAFVMEHSRSMELTMRATRLIAYVGAVAALVAGGHVDLASAEDLALRRPAHVDHIKKRLSAKHVSPALTVTPAPRARFAFPYVGGEPSAVGRDEADAYGDVNGFNPAPYVTSGVQFPFGLDGVGGFGSDLGFDAGESSSIYQR